MKILSLNIQGLGQKEKKEWIKEINFKHNINFLTLQETKMDKISHMDIKFIWGNSNYQFVVSDSVGNSGVFYVYGNLQFLSRIMPLYQITSCFIWDMASIQYQSPYSIDLCPSIKCS